MIQWTTSLDWETPHIEMHYLTSEFCNRSLRVGLVASWHTSDKTETPGYGLHTLEWNTLHVKSYEGLRSCVTLWPSVSLQCVTPISKDKIKSVVVDNTAPLKSFQFYLSIPSLENWIQNSANCIMLSTDVKLKKIKWVISVVCFNLD